jgi:hypothetical protein
MLSHDLAFFAERSKSKDDKEAREPGRRLPILVETKKVKTVIHWLSVIMAILKSYRHSRGCVTPRCMFNRYSARTVSVCLCMSHPRSVGGAGQGKDEFFQRETDDKPFYSVSGKSQA